VIDLLAFAYGLSLRLALIGLAGTGEAAMPELPEPSASLAYFLPKERSVVNWRLEAARSLSPTDAAVKMFTAAKVSAPRCVKLNNYWCVKHAGWNGTVAIDAENHVAFSSAVEGATVAAVLLKRYYVDYHRRTARAIISRWAPSPCASPEPVPRVAAAAPVIKRPRFAARGGRVRSVFNVPRRKSVVRHSYALTMMHAPEIAVGMGEDSLSHSLRTSVMTTTATRPSTSSLTRSMNIPTMPSFAPTERIDTLISSGLPMTACLDDPQRIQNYAARASQGVADGPDSDLHLFEEDGTPTPNLARVLSNMAQVEIGPLDVRMDLIEAAIARAHRQWASAIPKQEKDVRAAATSAGKMLR